MGGAPWSGLSLQKVTAATRLRERDLPSMCIATTHLRLDLVPFCNSGTHPICVRLCAVQPRLCLGDGNFHFGLTLCRGRFLCCELALQSGDDSARARLLGIGVRLGRSYFLAQACQFLRSCRHVLACCCVCRHAATHVTRCCWQHRVTYRFERARFVLETDSFIAYASEPSLSGGSF